MVRQSCHKQWRTLFLITYQFRTIVHCFDDINSSLVHSNYHWITNGIISQVPSQDHPPKSKNHLTNFGLEFKMLVRTIIRIEVILNSKKLQYIHDNRNSYKFFIDIRAGNSILKEHTGYRIYFSPKNYSSDFTHSWIHPHILWSRQPSWYIHLRNLGTRYYESVVDLKFKQLNLSGYPGQTWRESIAFLIFSIGFRDIRLLKFVPFFYEDESICLWVFERNTGLSTIKVFSLKVVSFELHEVFDMF